MPTPAAAAQLPLTLDDGIPPLPASPAAPADASATAITAAAPRTAITAAAPRTAITAAAPRPRSRPGEALATAAQLPLPLPASPSWTALDWIDAPENAAARQLLADPDPWPTPSLVLAGAAGCGKTHLTHIFLATSGAQLLNPPALDALAAAAAVTPGARLAIDPLEPWLATAVSQRALFHLLNALAAHRARLLLTARRPPARLLAEPEAGRVIADLASRLRAIPVVSLLPPGDGLRESLLAKLLSDQGLEIDRDGMRLLLVRGPRAPAACRALAERLQHLALTGRRRRLSIAVIRHALAEAEARAAGGACDPMA